MIIQKIIAKLFLPDKLSKLILVALNDLEKVEKDEKYKVDMGQWHHPPLYNGPCAVCLAGAVIAKTCKTSYKKDLMPGDFFENEVKKFNALDLVRQGEIFRALIKLGVDEKNARECQDKLWRVLNLYPKDWVNYWNDDDKKIFKDNLRRISKFLKDEGY